MLGILLLVLLIALAPAAGHAQSKPGWIGGQVITAPQLNNEFGLKQDYSSSLSSINTLAPTATPCELLGFSAPSTVALYSLGPGLSCSGSTLSATASLLNGVTKTSSYTLLPEDNRIAFNNNGAIGPVTFTLPTVAGHNGLSYCFLESVSQPEIIQTSGTDQLDIGANIGAMGGYASTTTVNSTLCLAASNQGQWVAYDGVGGVWSLDGATQIVGTLDAAGARAALGLGTMATQNASAVAITGGTIGGVSLSGALNLNGQTINGNGTFAGVNSYGTPSAIVLTHGTGLPLTTGVTGLLPIANGGTNASSQTTNGIVYDDGTKLTSAAGFTWNGATQLINLNAASAPTPPTGTTLQLVQADAASTLLSLDSFANATGLTGTRADGTNASKTAVQSGERLLSLTGRGYNGSAYSGNQAQIGFNAAGNWTTSSEPTQIVFVTTPSASTTSAVVANINSTGNVTIGDGTVDLGFTLGVQGTFGINGNAGAGIAGAVTTGHCVSFASATTIQDAGVTCGGGGGGGSVTSVGYSVNGGSSSGIFGVSGSPVTTSGSLNLSVTGVLNEVPRFSSTSALSTTSNLYSDGTSVGIGTASPGEPLDVVGMIRSTALTVTAQGITTTTTIAPSHCGVPMLAGGTSFYTVTLPSASGFPSGCRIRISNIDTSQGKTLSVSGLTSGGFVYAGCGIGNICPGQNVEYMSNGSNWTLTLNPGAWRPTGNITLYASTSGSNSNDGLSVSTPLTLSFACYARALIDASAESGGYALTIQLADGTYLGAPGASVCSITGNYGAGSSGIVFINGNNVTPTNVIVEAGSGGVSIFTKDIGETEVSNFEIAGNGNAVGISGAQGSIVDILGGIKLGCEGTNGNSLQFSQSSHLNIDTVVEVLGSCTQGSLAYLVSNADILASAGFQFDAGTISYTSAVFVNQGGFWNLIGAGYSVLGTVTGVKFANYGNSSAAAGTIYTGGVVPSVSFPGNVNQAFPSDFPTDFGTGAVYSQLPACTAINKGVRFWITDSNVTAWGSVVSSGGGPYSVGVACDGGAGYTVYAN